MTVHELRRSIRSLVAAVAVTGFAPAALGQGACCEPGAACTPVPDAGTCSALGGIFLDGASCLDGACGDGACCFETNCFTTNAFDCIAGGREFAGAGVTCLDDPCAADIGACCLGAGCSDLSPLDCLQMGGAWQGAGTSCAANSCDAGSCCVPGDCFDGQLADCIVVGGTFTSGTTCAGDPCEIAGACPTNSLYAQERDQPADFQAFVSEEAADVRRWDDYQGAAGAIQAVRWWGLDLRLSGGTFVECDEPINDFEISLSTDALGAPGTVVCTSVVSATRTPTGISYGGFELNEYEAMIPAPCILPDGWLSIVGLGDPNCWFLWMGSPEGNGVSFCAGCPSPDELKDMGFCLLGTSGGILGACCNLSTGVCADGVELADCIATGQRFEAGATGATLDPPCAVTTGACCFNDGMCAVNLADDCAAAGGQWLGGGTDCADCPDIGACCLGPTVCLLLPEPECLVQGWTWLGADTTCDDCPSLPECPPDTLFGQPPDGPDGFDSRTSELTAGFQQFEDYAGVGGPIEALTWWGLDLDFLGDSNWVECDDLTGAFQVSFHEDAGGAPGAPVCTHTVTVTRIPTGLQYFFAELIEYTVTLPEPCDLPSGWVSILGLGDPECWFLWMTHNFASGSAWCGGCPINEQFSDLAVCLRGTTGLPCEGDTNGDDQVDIDDIVNVILDFGTDGSANGGDVDGSGIVDIDDVVVVVLNFGPCV